MSKEKQDLGLTKEIVEKVLYLDCNKEDNIRRLKKSLVRLPMFKKNDDISTERLEEIIKKIEIKNLIHLAYIMRNVTDGEDLYSCMIKTDTGPEKGRWLKTVYAITIWESLAKTLFYMYYYIESDRKKIRKIIDKK